jgi:peptidoglycan/LPS O-acetylase OafA/YrhL
VSQIENGLHGIPERIPELDGLRGLAAVMVILHHISQSYSFSAAGSILRLWLDVTHAGWIGVDVFFALSGFLITRILLATHTHPHYYRNFFARRVLRLAPPFLITLALVALLVPGSGKFLVLCIFYLANFSTLFGIPMAYSPLWSLAVEEHFYLFWPWLVKFFSRRNLAAVGIFIVLATPPFRFYAQKFGFFLPYYSWFRFDGLMWGALLALVVTSQRSSRRIIRIWSVAVGLVGALIFLVGAPLGAMGRSSLIGNTVVFGAVAMATTGLIGLTALGDLRLVWAPLRSRVARFLGDISYWMYLFHVLVVDNTCKITIRILAARHLTADWLIYMIIATTVLVLIIGTGAAVRRLVELPVLRLKSRFR